MYTAKNSHSKNEIQLNYGVEANHLGNVLVTVSAKPRLLYDQNDVFLNKEADVTSVSDYFPFGSLLPERHWQSDTYRFGFNGKENDDEIKGAGNSVDFGARVYDTRIGNFTSTDILFKETSFQSPFIFAGNNPIYFIDKNGNFKLPTDDELKEQGLSPQDITRFKNIVNNIQNIVKDNPNAIDAIMKTTGFSREQIMYDLHPNQGPKINIFANTSLIYSQNGVINWSAEQVQFLQGINAENTEQFSEQVLATALTVLHEYGHYGDQVTNAYVNEYGTMIYPNSGQYSGGNWDADNTYVDRYALKSGNQKNVGGYEYSVTGHRGTDITILGYGVVTNLLPDGVSFNVQFPNLLSGGSNKPVTAKLPNSMQGQNILKTLNVE
ncbi:MAG: hypothetical protein PHT69_05275 [Bacteroidales bacterium]|nr:hypothetical protein [Bacteroidales bacterium]